MAIKAKLSLAGMRTESMSKDPWNTAFEIVFKSPKGGPWTVTGKTERVNLEKKMLGGYYPPAVGWIVCLGEVLLDKFGQIFMEIKQFAYL